MYSDAQKGKLKVFPLYDSDETTDNSCLRLCRSFHYEERAKFFMCISAPLHVVFTPTVKHSLTYSTSIPLSHIPHMRRTLRMSPRDGGDIFKLRQRADFKVWKALGSDEWKRGRRKEEEERRGQVWFPLSSLQISGEKQKEEKEKNKNKRQDNLEVQRGAADLLQCVEPGSRINRPGEERAALCVVAVQIIEAKLLLWFHFLRRSPVLKCFSLHICSGLLYRASH